MSGVAIRRGQDQPDEYGKLAGKTQNEATSQTRLSIGRPHLLHPTTNDVDWKTLLLRRLNRECAWGDMEPTWASKRVKELEKGK